MGKPIREALKGLTQSELDRLCWRDNGNPVGRRADLVQDSIEELLRHLHTEVEKPSATVSRKVRQTASRQNRGKHRPREQPLPENLPEWSDLPALPADPLRPRCKPYDPECPMCWADLPRESRQCSSCGIALPGDWADARAMCHTPTVRNRWRRRGGQVPIMAGAK